MAQTNRVSDSFTRPADTTAYAADDLVANSTTAASVVALQFGVNRLAVRRVWIYKSTNTTANGSFRAHFYTADPVQTAPTNGDNGALTINPENNYEYVGSADVTINATDVLAVNAHSAGVGTPNTGNEIVSDTGALYVLIEALAAYAPGSAEVFTVVLDCVPVTP